MYGFQKHLTKEFPSQVIIDVTQMCNLACIHCPHSDFIHTEAYQATNLDLKLHHKLIDEVSTDGYGYCQYVRYTANGEPLIHPKIDEILEYACKNSKTKVNLTTNGMFLNAKKVKKYLEFGLDAIDISIDAFKDETYAKVRKKGDLKVVRNNVLNLLKQIQMNGYKTKVIVSFVEQELNKEESDSFKEFWEAQGADFVIIRKLHSAGGMKEQTKLQINESFSTVKRKPCLYPWERLLLTPTGTIGFCPTDWQYSSEVADFRTQTIKEVWNGEFMNCLRQAHLSGNFESFNFCKQCPDWVYTKWPEEGKSYSNVMEKIGK